VPVVGRVPFTSSGCSASNVVVFGRGVAGCDSAELTVTVAEGGDVCVSGVVALSFTNSSKVYVSATVSTFAATEHVFTAPAAAPVPLDVPQIPAALVYVEPVE
jgi:alanine dehydrogenase